MDDGAFEAAFAASPPPMNRLPKPSRKIDGLLTASEACRTARRQSQDKEFGKAMMRRERLAERHHQEPAE
jgi:hypothetical protein